MRFEWNILAPITRPELIGPQLALLTCLTRGRTVPMCEPVYVEVSRLSDENDLTYGVSPLNTRVAEGAGRPQLIADVVVFLDSARRLGCDSPRDAVNAVRCRPRVTAEGPARDILDAAGGWLCWTWQLTALLQAAGLLDAEARSVAKDWAAGSLKSDQRIHGLEIPGAGSLRTLLAAHSLPGRRLHDFDEVSCLLPMEAL